MELLIKTYQNQFSTSLINVSEEINSVKIKEDLMWFDTMTITIPYLPNLAQMNKIELYEVTMNEDLLIFQWYIYNLSPWLNEISIIARSEKALMEKKLVLSDKNYSWQTITSIMNDLLNDWNTAYWETRTFESNITTTITKEFKKKDNLFWVLNELWELLDAVWVCKNNKITFNELIWEDKSLIWTTNFTEAIYNWLDPWENNITDVKYSSLWTVSNIIIGSDSGWDTTVNDTISIWTFGALWESKTFRDWDRANQTNKYLTLKKNEQKTLNIDIQTLTIEPNLWDKIKVRIENINEYINMETAMTVIKRDVDYKNWWKVIKIYLAEKYITMATFENTIKKIMTDVQLLKL